MTEELTRSFIILTQKGVVITTIDNNDLPKSTQTKILNIALMFLHPEGSWLVQPRLIEA